MKTIFIGIVLSLLFSNLACDSLFSLRDPESPKDTQSSWIPPLSSDIVLINLQNAILERNIENFIRCFSDPAYSDSIFNFDPDQEIAATYPEVFINWTLEDERVVLQQVFSYIPEDSSSYLLLTNEVWQTVVPDQAILAANYNLELNHTQSTLDQSYIGYLEFHMLTDRRGEWSIYRWIDSAVAELTSWSELKAILGG